MLCLGNGLHVKSSSICWLLFQLFPLFSNGRTYQHIHLVGYYDTYTAIEDMGDEVVIKI